MHTTQKDIAEYLGVSQSLVSRALSGKGGMIGASDETMVKIRKAADQMGYVHNVAARALRGGPSQTIGVIVFDFVDPFFGRILSVMQHLGVEANYSLVLTGSEHHGMPDNGVRQLMKHRIDGLIIVGSLPLDTWTNPLANSNTPIVQVGHGERTKGMRRVAVYEEIGAEGLLVRLKAEGHTTVGFIATSTWGHQRRLRVFKRCARQQGMQVKPEWIATHEGCHAEAGAKATRALLKTARDDLPTAIMAIDDELAQGALRALTDAGLSVPGDISLTGFDDIPAARVMVPSLTTVHQPIEQITRKAFTLVTDPVRFHEAQPDTILIPPTVCERESTGPAPAQS
ncbi:MAG: LacI family DNA-binding transcriptional regulator [Verrucomicrobia bacterium]|nr:LacI family DNA-binding transcriptional regulator [Verrucomicrobiota bacterium]